MESTNTDGRGRTPDIGGLNDATDERDGSVSTDDLFEVLHNGRRRRVVEYLLDGDGSATAGELAEHIAALENDTTVRELTSTERKRVYVSLYQNHLPMMDDANVVDYCDGRKTVRLTEGAAKLEPYLGDVSADEPDGLPVVLSLLFAGNVLLGGLSVPPFSAVPPAAWALAGAVALVGLVGLKAFRLR